VPLRLHVTPSVRCLSSRTRRSVLAAGTAAPFAITADDAPFVSNNANVLIGHRPPPPRGLCRLAFSWTRLQGEVVKQSPALQTMLGDLFE
jgi:hypothetical protein